MASRPLLLAAVLLGIGDVARAADIPQLLRDWRTLNGACRGGHGDNPATLVACDRRDAVDRQLAAAGWCYGRPGDAGYQRDWRPCTGTGR